ncbi:type II toxin-antitoxin system RelB/DinJ family antitoxin [uncultured Fibrobacter sp.]|uniref:type II toxin-antitoxin system RelB/DinJ family antitoxin n=1 Tax=uncultured Fibrobacter sp. TaxID=261512 RepID=UPI001B24F465|nr:type II toxin-antitoxin system RelB/DinJ family antitoxin [uncultured Fibrobacter sp.]MBO7550993.1 type II toxin-antitoxin system RelB/DinJ family antitoxin [Fibrobacter sp.]
MAQATISARIDAEDKERFDRFCNNVGLSSSAAIYMFIKNVINEHRIPFVVREPDAVYSAKNMKFLEEGIKALNAGKGVVHELIDEEG